MLQRIPKNRWTLILAVSLVAALCSVRGSSASVGGTPLRNGDPDPIPTPQAGGDPDVPDGHTGWNKAPAPYHGMLEGQHAGDMWTLRPDGMWRLIMILRGLRYYWFRF